MNQSATGKTNRPPHDRSKYLKDGENNLLIQLVEREDGIVSISLSPLNSAICSLLLVIRRFQKYVCLLFEY